MKLQVQIPEQGDDLSMLLPLFDYNWHFQSVVSPSSSSSFSSDDDDEEGDEKNELYRVFKAFDANDDGLVSKDEVRNLMNKLRSHDISDEELDLLMLTVDLNGDGCIDFDEFHALYTEVQNGDSSSDDDYSESNSSDEIHHVEKNEELKEAFRIFDKNNDGFITAEELHTVLSNLGFVQGGRSFAACRKMIQGVDSNGDGLVDFDEFKHMMTSKASPRTYFASEAVF